MVGLVIFILFISGILACAWAKGIDCMIKNYPDYKGEDFLDWGDNKDCTETK